MISNMCQVITSRSQVIAYRSQVASNSMSSDKHRKYTIQKTIPIQGIDTHTEKWYRYKRLIRTQKNSTNITDQCVYRKTTQI